MSTAAILVWLFPPSLESVRGVGASEGEEGMFATGSLAAGNCCQLVAAGVQRRATRKIGGLQSTPFEDRLKDTADFSFNSIKEPAF